MLAATITPLIIRLALIAVIITLWGKSNWFSGSLTALDELKFTFPIKNEKTIIPFFEFIKYAHGYRLELMDTDGKMAKVTIQWGGDLIPIQSDSGNSSNTEYCNRFSLGGGFSDGLIVIDVLKDQIFPTTRCVLSSSRCGCVEMNYYMTCVICVIIALIILSIEIYAVVKARLTSR